jgi:adenosylmethionine-8-amino-7-oxononanoate aminotransferase
VSGAALGAMAAPKGYWPAVRILCDKHGILLHLDEVMCGMGRTGTYFAFEQEGIKPDIVTIGKGLGGGYAAIAGMLVNDKIIDALRKGTSSFNHGHTFQAHPVSSAIAYKVQQIVRKERLVERSAEKGEEVTNLLQEAFTGAKYVADIRGSGLFHAVEFMRDPATKEPFAKEVGFAARVQLAAFDLGVAVYLGVGTVDGFLGDHVLVAPPYTVSDKELAITVMALKKAYDKAVAGLDNAEF